MAVRIHPVGSSPRMRGALSISFLPGFGLRIIPADAGSTMPIRTNKIAHKDHPRGCGEHTSAGVRFADSRGSSPRMRGAHPSDLRIVCQPGIIPADAGSTRTDQGTFTGFMDHPRGCGEHEVTSSSFWSLSGSSPRMRGAHIIHFVYQIMERIIPADAGSTSSGFPGKNPM